MKYIICTCSCGCKNEIPNYNVTGLCLHCYRDHRNLQEYLTANKYQCGHQIKPVFIKKNIVQFALYKQWKESGSKLCFKCWDEQNKKEFLKVSKKVLERKNKYHIGICKKCGIKRLLGNEDNLCADCIDVEDVDLNEVIERVKAKKELEAKHDI